MVALLTVVRPVWERMQAQQRDLAAVLQLIRPGSPHPQ
jgi:hypothetical protein